MTHGGLQKLGNGIGLTYPRPSVTAARAKAIGQPAEEPISVNVSVRSPYFENAYTATSEHASAPGQCLDCYI